MQENQTRVDVEKVAKGASTILVGATVGKLVFFLNQILISRALGLDVFGLYALGIAAVRAAEILARLGLNVGGMRFVSIYRNEDASKVKGVLISAAGLSMVIGVGVGLVFLLTSNW
jgi:O-antigen/teichoic acid export membrane protein